MLESETRELAPQGVALPTIIAADDKDKDPASIRFLEVFAANIRNPQTRRAYSHAVMDFMT